MTGIAIAEGEKKLIERGLVERRTGQKSDRLVVEVQDQQIRMGTLPDPGIATQARVQNGSNSVRARVEPSLIERADYEIKPKCSHLTF